MTSRDRSAVALSLFSAVLLLMGCTPPPSHSHRTAAPARPAPAASQETPAEPPIHAAPPKAPVQSETLGSLEAPIDPDFSRWLAGVREEALKKGIRAATLDQALAGLKPIPRVIELDRNQPEFKLTYAQYLEKVLPAARIAKGRRMLAENRALLERISGTYGVPARYLVAFWGIESDFGRITGGFPVIAALATLAHDGRRSTFFRRELMNALKIVDEGHVTAGAMVGSWAGAMGQCQFMPSSFVRFAVDGDGDGRKDLWTSKADVFASAANYLAASGWKRSQDWGMEVKLPPRFDRRLGGGDQKRTLATWDALGIRDTRGRPLPRLGIQAALIEPEPDNPPAFLVFDNYATILKWNRSMFYALAVGQLADAIGGR